MGRKKNDTPEKIAEEHIRQAAETHVTGLNLSELSLQQLPESLGQLTALQLLFLDGNQLSALPESLGQLSKLRELFLHDNPRLGLPSEVLGPSSEEVYSK
jgi:internalin A